jgi:hypothetical protein
MKKMFQIKPDDNMKSNPSTIKHGVKYRELNQNVDSKFRIDYKYNELALLKKYIYTTTIIKAENMSLIYLVT